MTTFQVASAKSSGPGDCSDGVVVSFDAKWYAAIVAKGFSLVIRKRIPVNYKPTWMYFHVKAPKRAICARAKIISVSWMQTGLVRTHASELCLHKSDINEYCGSRQEVGVYRIGEIELASVDVSTAELQRQLRYTPPQSFMYLSQKAKTIIDTVGNFTKVSVAPERVIQ